MSDLGKLLIFVGGAIVVTGLALIGLGRTGLPLGRLPGDFVYRSKNTTLYLPAATSILVSVFLSVLLWVLGRMRH